MVDEGESVFTWVEEIEGQPYAPVRQKRKYTHKKMEYVGWGSRLLIEFLMSLDKDVSEQISQHDASDIINKYVQDKNLLHPSKKKKIICDDRLHSLFGKKMINRIKIFDLLEVHYAENQDSDDEFLYSSDDNEKNTPEMYRQEKSEKKSNVKKKVRETPKSNFAAIIPKNIKLLYLKRTLVQDLSKDHESFENKIVRSFVRIKSDPNDYLQKNSHLLVQVTGVKKGTGCSDGNAELLLQVSYAIGEIQICKLSEDNFSEEECEDLRQRVKDGLLKRMTVGELEQKAQILHEDITKHWLVRELALLQSLIDRANEKGWRKEMFEHLERRDLLQTPSKQAELLRDVPEVVPDELETEAIAQESLNDESEDWPESITPISNNTYRSNLVVTPVLSTSAAVGSATVDSQSSARTNIAELAAVPSDMPHITEKCNIASPKSIPHLEISGVDQAEVKTDKTKFSGSAVYERSPVRIDTTKKYGRRTNKQMLSEMLLEATEDASKRTIENVTDEQNKEDDNAPNNVATHEDSTVVKNVHTEDQPTTSKGVIKIKHAGKKPATPKVSATDKNTDFEKIASDVNEETSAEGEYEDDSEGGSDPEDESSGHIRRMTKKETSMQQKGKKSKNDDDDEDEDYSAGNDEGEVETEQSDDDFASEDNRDLKSLMKKRKSMKKSEDRDSKKLKMSSGKLHPSKNIKIVETAVGNKGPVSYRASPKHLATLVQGLSDTQRQWVKSVGFGNLLQFNITGLPLKLGYYILSAFDYARVTMKLHAGEIAISEKDVAEVLGLPRGRENVSTSKKNTSRIKEWRAQFSGKTGHKITLRVVAEKALESTVADDMFKWNFLMVMTNVLIQSLGNPYVNQRILNFDGDLDSLGNYNWCKELMESLLETKRVWEQDTKKIYNGPLVFLTLLYVDRLVCIDKRSIKRATPAFIGWTEKMLQEREKSDCNDKLFGQGNLEQSHYQKTSRMKKTKQIQEIEMDDVESAEEYGNNSIEKDILKGLETAAKQYLHWRSIYEGKLNLARAVIPGNTQMQEIEVMINRVMIGNSTASTSAPQERPLNSTQKTTGDVQENQDSNSTGRIESAEKDIRRH